MAQKTSYNSINSDDDQVTRVFSLALRFFGSRLPISSSSIWSEFYPNCDEDNFKRTYLRDRELLASLGIVIREADRDGAQSLWQINQQASYMQGDGISAEDARMLYILCYDMVSDRAFPFRDELRMALAKISQMYQGGTLQLSGDDQQDRDHLSVLVSAMSTHRAVDVTYVDARGRRSQRRLALLGSFGMRERTYFVASRIERSGELVPDSLRTYRLDRFEKVTFPRRTISYEVPLDFSVHDFERLPFQIGDSVGIARLSVPSEPEREVSRAMHTNGSIGEDGCWEVAYSNADALASWCVAGNVVPLAPKDLLNAYESVLRRTAEATLLMEEPARAISPADPPKPKGRAGRKGGTLLARQLMTLATSLTNEGEVITAEQVAESLGVSYDRARHLILLMTMTGLDSYEYLPVVADDDYREVFLMEGACLSAPRLRLNQSETLALMAALTELGVPDDDPLAQALSSSFASPSLSLEDLARSLEFPSSDACADTLHFCSQAICQGKGLGFSYRPVSGGDARTRRVIPLYTHRNDDSWYLDAYDLDRQDQRIFRLDRMSDLAMRDEVPPAPPKLPHQQQTVLVRFTDRAYLELFFWEGLKVCAVDEQGTLASIPYYGGDWLARHLAACAGTLRTTSAELAERAAAIARRLLEAR